jgi:hypothetical protein
MSSGSSAAAIAGNVGVQTGTINLWGIQLEIAQPGQTQPTPLEKPDPVMQLQQCERFYQYGAAAHYGNGTAGSQIANQPQFRTLMRATPTIQFVIPGYSNASGIVASSVSPAGFICGAVVTATAMAAFTTQYTASADL